MAAVMHGPLHRFDAGDEALGPAEAERLVEELRAFPDPPLKPYNDGSEIQKHIEEKLVLSRRQWAVDGHIGR
jgi:hypothetical protein